MPEIIVPIEVEVPVGSPPAEEVEERTTTIGATPFTTKEAVEPHLLIER